MAEADVRRTIEAVWRIESARLIAGAARLVRDVGLAEDLAQEALVAALEEWPESGVPDNPGAWLMATAKHRGIDRLRRADVHQRKIEEIGRLADSRRPESPPATTRSTTTCCGSSSPRAIPCCPPRRGWGSRSACCAG
jgi:predicted RNA polymerase sigma factor